MFAFAPIPSARATTAMATNPGLLASRRAAYRRSLRNTRISLSVYYGKKDPCVRNKTRLDGGPSRLGRRGLEVHLGELGLFANRLAPVGAGLFLLADGHEGVA